MNNYRKVRYHKNLLFDLNNKYLICTIENPAILNINQRFKKIIEKYINYGNRNICGNGNESGNGNEIKKNYNEIKRYVNTVDRNEAAETIVSILIDNDSDVEDIRNAFKGDADIKRALTAYLDNDKDYAEDEEEEVEDEDYNEDEDWEN